MGNIGKSPGVFSKAKVDQRLTDHLKVYAFHGLKWWGICYRLLLSGGDLDPPALNCQLDPLCTLQPRRTTAEPERTRSFHRRKRGRPPLMVVPGSELTCARSKHGRNNLLDQTRQIQRSLGPVAACWVGPTAISTSSAWNCSSA